MMRKFGRILRLIEKDQTGFFNVSFSPPEDIFDKRFGELEVTPTDLI